MHKIKSHSTVEKIAKKHRLDVSFVERQLNMGIPIEHEHTNDKDLATDIALQHLDEIPDYYTRLKKMEASAKKEHKKYKDIKENAVNDLQKGIVKLPNKSYKSIDSLMRTIMKKRKMTAKELHNDFVDKHHQTPDTWAKKNMKEEADDNGFTKCWPGKKKKGFKMKKGRKVNNCVPVKEATEMKRYCPKCAKEETRGECKYGQKYWDMFSMPITLKHYTPNTPHPGNIPESRDHEHSMARSELATIASAIKRLRKKMGGEGDIEAWVQSKITKAADYLDTAADYVDSGEMKVENVQRGPILPNEKGKTIYPKGQEPKPTGAKLFPLAKDKKSKTLDLAHYDQNANYIEEDDNKEKQSKFDRRVNAAMAIKNPASRIKILSQAASIHPSKTFEEFVIEAKTAAWQRKEGKKESGGLNQKGVMSYRKQHPGSKLKTAVTTKPSKLKKGSKSANRRKSFCSRMSGMKSKLTSAKTARDPNSRINKSLRAWNC